MKISARLMLRMNDFNDAFDDLFMMIVLNAQKLGCSTLFFVFFLFLLFFFPFHIAY